jgi:gamma-glutamyltranspeptidase/glutathione hydrolase
MKGAVAAGHPLTAEAGARAFEQGGNAVDACVSAAFMAWITESPLTGPGAGGFMLVHRARDAVTRLLDFFVSVPGRGLEPGAAEMEPIAIDFDGQTTQTFLVGAGSCAVPGSVAGLFQAHREFGRLPWREVIAPAIDRARSGVILSEEQGYLHAILDPILRRERLGREIYGTAGPLEAGERLVMRDLADTLELLADGGEDVFYRGELAQRIVSCIGEGGGRVTAADLAAYRVIRRRPLRVGYRGLEFVTNGPPSAGGVLIALGLRVLDRLGRVGARGSPRSVATLVEVMREAARARGGRFVADLHRGGAASRLLSDASVEAVAEAVRSALREPAYERRGLPSTTHVSVVDANGDAASLSTSTGAGSGVVVAGTGINLNNMLGEIDLNPGGRAPPAGRRLTSMMAPSMVLEDGRPRLVLGSAGSERLRGAVLQVVVNVVDHGLGAQDAIEEPRVHLDGDTVHLEGGSAEGLAEELERLEYPVVRWEGRNLFFGGAAAVAARGRGEFEAAGDPRRGGAGVVV